MDPAPRLACQQCKQRKLRCDKGSPCTACRAAGLACQIVQRARLPRGKSGKSRKQKKSLDVRLKQLEDLIAQHNEIPDLYSTCVDRAGPKSSQSQILAPDFWSSLTNSIAGLRETLDDSEPESDDNSVEEKRCFYQMVQPASMDVPILFSSLSRQDYVPPTLSHTISIRLFEFFKDRVDTVYKVVHLPTVLASLQRTHRIGEQTVSESALKYAMYWVALCTLTDNETSQLGLGPRDDLLGSYRAAVEHFLASSDLMNHPNLTSLQALIIYMIGLRTCLNNATTWTLVAVAARIATALRLGDEDPCQLSTFELDTRRRALFAIGILDTHAALDRGTIPLLPASTFRMPPMDINDIDISPESGSSIHSLAGITDMTHSMMTYKAMLCQRRMYELSRNGIKSWSERLQLVADFGTHVDGLQDTIGDSQVPIHMLIVASGRKIHRSLELLLRRPPYRQPTNAVPAWDTLDIMLLATEVLELHLAAPTPELTPWVWKNWVQWHALAVVLAELLVRPSSPLTNRGFKVASTSFDYYASIVADSQSGMLWKPIVRLMRRVQNARREAATHLAHITPQDTVPDSPVIGDDLFIDDIPHDMAARTAFEPAVNPLIDEDPDNFPVQQDQSPWLAWDAFIEDIIDFNAWN